LARETKVTMEWNGDEVMRAAMRQLSINADRVGMMLDGAVVRSLSKGQPVKRVGKDRKARLVGLQPSRPGEPPRLLHGLLRNSIAYRKEIHPREVEVYIGANTKYARALEYGNPKKNLKARPYLRPAIENNRDKAIKRLVKGVFPKNARGRR
jgi:phage gpG-like protein